jgi:hypothetical protein
MNRSNAFLILLLSNAEYSEPLFILDSKAEILKMDYSSKEKSSNDRDFLVAKNTVEYSHL